MSNTSDFEIEYGFLIHYRGNNVDVVIPEEVHVIGEKAFLDKDIRTVVIPNTVARIEHHAFFGCDKLRSVSIPPSVVSIGSYAFYACPALEEISVSHDIDIIGQYAFHTTKWFDDHTGFICLGGHCFGYRGSETELFFPEGIRHISQSAFENYLDDNCPELTAVTLPSTLETIEEDAFAYQDKLRSVDLGGTKLVDRHAFYNCKALEQITNDSHVVSVGTGAFFRTQWETAEPLAVLGSVLVRCNTAPLVIPPFVRTIAENACWELHQNELVVPETVQNIENQAFYGGSFQTLYLNASHTKYLAFQDCTELETVYLGTSSKCVWGAFLNCSSLHKVFRDGAPLKHGPYHLVSLPHTIQFLADEPEDPHCYKPGYFTISSRSFSLLEKQSGDAGLFDGIRALVVDDDDAAWQLGYYMKLFPNVERICVSHRLQNQHGYYCVDGVLHQLTPHDCTLSLYPPAKPGAYEVQFGVTEIGLRAFSYCKVSSISFPNTLKLIEDAAIYHCDYIETLHIPHTVTWIGDQGIENPFPFCRNLRQITMRSEHGLYFDRDGVLYKGNGTLLSYPAGREEPHFAVPRNCGMIGSHAFSCSQLETIELPEEVDFSVCPYAFSHCSNLRSLTISKNCKFLGDDAISHCPQLSALHFESPALMHIEDSHFTGCENLRIYTSTGYSIVEYAIAHDLQFFILPPQKQEDEP